MKRVVLGISAGISFLIFLILAYTATHLWQGQTAQTVAERWSDTKGYSQVSCFFSADSGISTDIIEDLEHRIDNDLADAGVFPDPDRPGARRWMDAYSATGEITLSTDRTTISINALGVGGDFFQFHPLPLRSGYYFSGNDVIQDYCVIDQDAAWQLFGALDVAGMTVSINGAPHIITGVVDRGDSKLEKAAGLNGSLAYVSYETLSNLGTENGINHYEIVMPNPISGYATQYLKDNLCFSEKTSEIVENTSRYSLLSRLKRIPQFGTRSMNSKAIIYPYWENIARGYEDYLTVITVAEMFFLLYTVLVVLGLICYWWKHKQWTVKGVGLYLLDKAERWGEKMRAKRMNAFSQLRLKKRKRGE